MYIILYQSEREREIERIKCREREKERIRERNGERVIFVQFQFVESRI